MAYENSFRCAVLTPTQALFTGDVYYADVPGFVGHYGVIKGHESLVATNHQGGKLTLWLDAEGHEKKTFLIHLGCSQVLNNHLSVLGRFGCDPSEIDLEDIKKKADALREEITQRREQLKTLAEEDRSADEAWIANEEIRLSWYETQIDYASKDGKTYKQ